MATAYVQSPLLLRNKKKIDRSVANVKSSIRVNGNKINSRTTTKTTTGENTNAATVTVVETNFIRGVRVDVNTETTFETTKSDEESDEEVIIQENEEYDEEEEQEEEEEVSSSNLTDLIDQMNNASLNGTEKEVCIK